MKNNNFIQMNQNNRVSLYEWFYFNQKTDLFNDQNQNYCNICNQLNDSLYTSIIYSSRNALLY